MLIPVEKDNPTTNTPYLIYLLIGINTVIFLLSKHHYELESSITTLGFVPAHATIQAAFTSIFIHGGYEHLIGNMLFFYMFGDNVEDVIGKGEFIVAYFICGLLSVLTYYILNHQSNIPLVGASGAISGILGIYMVLFPHAHVDLVMYGRHGQRALLAHISSKGAVLIWLLFQLALGLLFINKAGGIAFSAHVGGLLVGFGIGFILKEKLGYIPKPPQKELCFERDKISDIWCPHCGHKEESRDFGKYECGNCGTKYEITKSEYYEEPEKEYKKQTININDLPVIEKSEVPSNAKVAHIFTEEEGIEYKYSAYLENENSEPTVMITLDDGKSHRLLARKTFNNINETKEYLRHETRFIISDFAKS